MTHPLFGLLLAAASFRRVGDVLFLVVRLPDGSPGTIRADATDVLAGEAVAAPTAVLDAEGVRALHRLVRSLSNGRGVRGPRRGKTNRFDLP